MAASFRFNEPAALAAHLERLAPGAVTVCWFAQMAGPAALPAQAQAPQPAELLHGPV